MGNSDPDWQKIRYSTYWKMIRKRIRPEISEEIAQTTILNIFKRKHLGKDFSFDLAEKKALRLCTGWHGDGPKLETKSQFIPWEEIKERAPETLSQMDYERIVKLFDPLDQNLLRLYFEEGLSQREIADELGMTKGNVENHFKEIYVRIKYRLRVIDLKTYVNALRLK